MTLKCNQIECPGYTIKYFYDLFKDNKTECISELFDKYYEVNHIDVEYKIRYKLSNINVRYHNIRKELKRFDESDTLKSRLDLVTRFRSMLKETYDELSDIRHELNDIYNDSDDEEDSNDYSAEYDGGEYKLKVPEFILMIVIPKIEDYLSIIGNGVLYDELTSYMHAIEYEYY